MPIGGAGVRGSAVLWVLGWNNPPEAQRLGRFLVEQTMEVEFEILGPTSLMSHP